MDRDVGMAFGLIFLLLFAYLLIGICIFAYAVIPAPFNIIFLVSLAVLAGYKFILSMRKEKQRWVDNIFYTEKYNQEKKEEKERRERYYAEREQKRRERIIERKAKEESLKKAMKENPNDSSISQRYFEFLTEDSDRSDEESYYEMREMYY